MSIAIDKSNIGTNFNDSVVATIDFTTNQTVSVGGFIVVVVGWFNGSALLASVAGGGLTWNVDQSSGSGALAPRSAIASAQAPSGLVSGTTITATLDTTSAARTIGGLSFTGVKTSSPLDGATGKVEATAQAGWSTGSIALSAGSVLIATNFNEGAVTGSTPTSPSIETFEVLDPVFEYGSVQEYRIESSAGNYTVEGTWNAAHNHCTAYAAYLASTDAPAADTQTRRYRIRRSRGTSW